MGSQCMRLGLILPHCIHSFNKYLLRLYSMPDTNLGTILPWTNQSLCPQWSFHSSVGSGKRRLKNKFKNDMSNVSASYGAKWGRKKDADSRDGGNGLWFLSIFLKNCPAEKMYCMHEGFCGLSCIINHSNLDVPGRPKNVVCETFAV